MTTTLAVATTTSVPWWYVAALAGGFTIFGALVTFTGVVITSRRKNRLDDARRFDQDVIAAFVTIDAAVDVMHNNIGDTAEKREQWWETYRGVIRTAARLHLITTRKIASQAEWIRILMGRMAPGHDHEFVMPELVECLEELRVQIREDLRIGREPRELRVRTYLRQWWTVRGYKRIERKAERLAAGD